MKVYLVYDIFYDSKGNITVYRNDNNEDHFIIEEWLVL